MGFEYRKDLAYINVLNIYVVYINFNFFTILIRHLNKFIIFNYMCDILLDKIICILIYLID